MELNSLKFIAATQEISTFDKPVAAPYLRKTFALESLPGKASLTICGLGFYDLYINGIRRVKGELPPYVSNSDDIVCFDEYDVTDLLAAGENVIGVVLGNGMQDSFGGYIWDFEKAKFRSAPKLAIGLECDGHMVVVSDTSFTTASSPIIFNDLRSGEHYDSRRDIPGWNKPGFDDSSWKNAIWAETPRGQRVLAETDPIVIVNSYKPVSITPHKDGFMYDFGINTAGVCKLVVQGNEGQTISLEHGEVLTEQGDLSQNIKRFLPEGYTHKDVYICSGGKEEYVPRFTYHGFRYVYVTGITAQQATPELLTYLEMCSDIKEKGSFTCSDETAVKLQEFTRRSTLSNFYYFPTDCPHREKNGWTGDAALSAEHMLLNLSVEKSFAFWLRHIRQAQAKNGALPGIVPTGGWGFAWGNGPAWDCALTYIPYFYYLYNGEENGGKGILADNANAIFQYISYLSEKTDERGLVAFGLGDWCPPGREADDYKSPLAFTDSVISMDICKKAAFIFDRLGMTNRKNFADTMAAELRKAIRKHLLNGATAAGNCQTSQAMGLFYNIFEPGQRQEAFQVLLSTIRREGGHIDTGILGARVIFHVLAEFGYADLAFEMITREDYPSYGNWVKRGATTLWEAFWPEGDEPLSMNHHFFGDISAFFIKRIGGIIVNPHELGPHTVNIAPAFIEKLNHAKSHTQIPAGKVQVEWRRCDDDSVEINIEIPEGVCGWFIAPNNYTTDNGKSQLALGAQGLKDEENPWKKPENSWKLTDGAWKRTLRLKRIER